MLKLFNVYIITLLIAGIINLFTSLYIYYNPLKFQLRKLLSLLLLIMSIYLFGSAVERLSRDFNVIFFLILLQYICVALSISILIIIGIIYEKLEKFINLKFVFWSLILPVLSYLLVLYLERDSQVFLRLKQINIQNYYIITILKTPFYYLITMYNVILLIFILLSFVKIFLFRKGNNSNLSLKLIFILVLIILPFVYFVIYQLNIILYDIDINILFVLLIILIIIYFIIKPGLYEMIPLTGIDFTNNLSEGIILLDYQDKIIDINNVALHLFKKEIDIIGKNIEELDENLYSFVKNNNSELEFKTSDEKYLSIKITELKDKKSKGYFNRIVIIDDITELKIREKAINEELNRKKSNIYLAQNIQKRLNTQVIPNFKWLDIQAVFLPSEEMGGDFFEVRKTDDGRLIVVLGDCTGHGITASMNATIMKLIYDKYIYLVSEYNSTDMFLKSVNEESMKYLSEDQFPTLFVGILDSDNMIFTYSSANSEMPFLIRNKETLKVSRSLGFHLNLSKNSSYEKKTIKLEDNDLLIFYSDALIEASEGYNRKINLEEIKTIFSNLDGRLDKDIKVVLDYIYNKQINEVDDLTMILVKIKKPFIKEIFVRKIDELEEYVREFQKIIMDYGYDEKVAGNCSVFFYELANNGIVHGNKNDPSKLLSIFYEINYEYVKLVIKDEGNGFDPMKYLKPPDIEYLLSQLKGNRIEEFVHGRGIYLSKLISDNLFYNEKGNEVTCIKFRHTNKTIYK